MRPLELELQGFGPYADKQLIPFDRLDPVFLIGGDTGAGKTTLFDAISYALYGQPLGTRASDQVRSNLVADDVSTYVRFRFACGGAVWEVYRSPYTVRAAKRGGGTVVEEITTLQQIGADGVRTPFPGKPGEINRKLAGEILKLSHDHFSKILVLPQGEFQRFLEMESSQRGVILERLFPIEEHRLLKTRADDSVRGILAAVKEKEAALAEVRRGLLAGPEVADLEAHLDAADAALVGAVSQAAQTELGANKAAQTARAALDAAGLLARQLEQLATATAERAVVESQREATDAARQTLDASRRATLAQLAIDAEAKLRAQVGEAASLLERQTGARDAATARREAMRAQVDALPARESALRAAEEAQVGLESRVGDLTSLVSAETACRTAAEAVTATVERVGAAAQAVAGAEASLAELAAPAAARTPASDAARAARDRVGALDALAPDAKRIRDWSERYAPELDKRRASARTSASRLQAEEEAARVALDTARARRDAQAAAWLAGTLTEGAACPVCGSVDHPAPAHGGAGDEDLRASVANAERALASATSAVAADAATQREVESKAGVLLEVAEEATQRLVAAGFGDVGAWQQAKVEADTEQRRTADALTTLEATLATRPTREKALELVRARKAAADEAAAKAAVDQASAEASKAALIARVGAVDDVQAALARARAELVAARTRTASEREAILALRAAWSALESEVAAAAAAVTTTSDSLAALRARTAAALAAVTEALVAQGFWTAEDALAAVRAPAVEASLRRQVDAWVERVTQLDTQVRDLSAAVSGRAAPDLVLLRQEAESTAASAVAATAARAGAERDLSDLRVRRARHVALQAEIDALTQDSAGLLQLAKDLGGDNARRVDFPTYVLMGWLNQVLARATTRLQVLSEGRYRFALRADVTDRRKAAGLDVDVFDAYSADRRDVKTLSGGEKFMASLSLALGLADVIQERAGGIELDTLFIDEGFGSLDPSAMDRALQVIDEIGAHRRVGVISHVESVKKAIPCHVLVEKSPTGSTVRVG